MIGNYVSHCKLKYQDCPLQYQVTVNLFKVILACRKFHQSPDKSNMPTCCHCRRGQWLSLGNDYYLYSCCLRRVECEHGPLVMRLV